MRKLLNLILIVICTTQSYAQRLDPIFTLCDYEITGPNSARQFDLATYSYGLACEGSFPQWSITGGEVISQYSNAGINYVDVRWTQPGTGKVELYEFIIILGPSADLLGSKNVNVTAAVPPQRPSAPVVSGSQPCGSKTLSATSMLGNGEQFYWQTSPSGTLTNHSGAQFVATQSGQYYLRVRNLNSSLWSNASPGVTVSIDPKPVSLAPGIEHLCGETKLIKPVNSGGISYYWQSIANGTATGSGNSQSELHYTAPTTFYVRARSSSGCWGDPYTVNVTIQGIAPPEKPEVPNISYNCGYASVSVQNSEPGILDYFLFESSGELVEPYDLLGGSATKYWGLTFGGNYYIYSAYGGVDALCISDTTAFAIDRTFINPIVEAGPDIEHVKSDGVLQLEGALPEGGSWLGLGVSGNTFNPANLGLGTYEIKYRYAADGTSCYVDDYKKIRLIESTPGIEDNYVRTYLPTIPTTNHTLVPQLPVDEVNEQITYFDGLSRPIVKSALSASPGQQDLISISGYDGFGRNNINYLPYSGVATGVSENSVFSFYSGGNEDIAQDNQPHAVTVFERSPLNRVLEQGAPGTAWQPGTGETITYGYKVNSSSDTVFDWEINAGNQLRALGTFANNELINTVTTDEEGHAVIEFVNKRSETLLKRVQGNEAGTLWADTYYVYDDFGNLRYVLPPEAIAEIGSPSTFPYAPSPTLSDNWAFQYKYDGRQRMIEKKVPGAEPVFMIYDQRDRLVMTQDGNQRMGSKNEWTFTKYDALNRPILTGIIDKGALTVDQIRAEAEAITVFFEDRGSAVHGYTNNSYPSVSNANNYLTATYYDDYTFPHAGSYTFVEELGNPAAFGRVKGQVTGSKVKNIDGSNTWLESVTYYDDRYRVIQTQTQTLLGGVDRVSNRYDFIGQLLETKTTHNTTRISKIFDYDHAGRLVNTWHQINDEPRVLLAHNEYNELGELIEKNLHSEDEGTTFAQSTDYRYNIRGWLKSINNAQLANTIDNNDTGQATDYWGMELGYNHVLSGISATPTYNGNISAVKWSDNLGLGDATNVKRRAYVYTYDPMNRIKTADHRQYTSAWTANNHFQLSGLTYDLNGNIESLTRRNETGGTMDVLVYDYTGTGNQLRGIRDDGNDTEGFKDGTNVGDDYLYDDNGNMTRDENKNIGTITYNHLNLPQRVEKDANNYILYTYDAAGIKLRQEVYEAGALSKTTDYVGKFIYENDTLQLIQHEEGRLVPTLPGLDPGSRAFEYLYHLKDHLGNTRLTFTTNPKEVEFKLNYESSTTDPDDETLFSDLNNIITANVHDYVHPDETFNHTEVQLLNGAAGGVVGSVLTFAVGAGDKVSAEVYAKYLAPTGTNNPTAAVGNLVISAIAGGTVPSNYDGAITSGYGPGGTVTGLINTNASSTEPMAFINLLFLPDDVTGSIATNHFAFKQITSASSNSQAILELDQPYEAPEAGYVVVYLSNESAKLTEVYFDDLKVTVNEHPVIQTDDYYPFGLEHAGGYQRVTAKENKFDTFQGKERIDDLDLGWISFTWRNHDPSIGRFFNVDPLAEKYYYNSPYAFSENKVTAHIELEGLEAWDIKNEWTEETIAQYNDYITEKGNELNEQGVSCTCEDFALTTLIDFASENNLPVTLENGEGIFDASSESYSSVDEFKNDILSTTGAPDLQNPYNTEKVTEGEGAVLNAQAGDILLNRNDSDVATHVQVVTSNDGDFVNIRQGNSTPFGSSNPRSGFYVGTEIQSGSYDTTTGTYWRDGKPTPNAVKSFNNESRRWNFSGFNIRKR
ncbi:MAG: DUF6443 domain-containing protein [Bacteroidota bacterium]